MARMALGTELIAGSWKPAGEYRLYTMCASCDWVPEASWVHDPYRYAGLGHDHVAREAAEGELCLSVDEESLDELNNPFGQPFLPKDPKKAVVGDPVEGPCQIQAKHRDDELWVAGPSSVHYIHELGKGRHSRAVSPCSHLRVGNKRVFFYCGGQPVRDQSLYDLAECVLQRYGPVTPGERVVRLALLP